jgi:hypothetical protein
MSGHFIAVFGDDVDSALRLANEFSLVLLQPRQLTRLLANI